MLKKRNHGSTGKEIPRTADIIHLEDDDDEGKSQKSEEEYQNIQEFLELEERKKRQKRKLVIPRDVERAAEVLTLVPLLQSVGVKFSLKDVCDSSLCFWVN